ncbi:hypothetical protein ACP70R_005451 [Stipagrostis hirtigluma subsp. patula]
MGDIVPKSNTNPTDRSALDTTDDFKFPILAGSKMDMCVADELFSHWKKLRLNSNSVVATDDPKLVLLPRSVLVVSTMGLETPPNSPTQCVSRSHLSKSASSNHAVSMPPRPVETKNAATLVRGEGGNRSVRLKQSSSIAIDKKLGLGLFWDTLGCKRSANAIEPECLPEAATQSETKDVGMEYRSSARRNRILALLQRLSITKGKECTPQSFTDVSTSACESILFCTIEDPMAK